MKIIIDGSLEVVKIICVEKNYKKLDLNQQILKLAKFLTGSSEHRTVFAVTKGRQLTNSYAGIKCS